MLNRWHGYMKARDHVQFNLGAEECGHEAEEIEGETIQRPAVCGHLVTQIHCRKRKI